MPGPRKTFRWPARSAALTAAGLTLAACGPDIGQIALCEQIVYRLVGPPDRVEIVAWIDDAQGPHTLAAAYRIADDGGRTRRLVCAFEGSGIGEARLRLVDIRYDDGRRPSRASIAYLKRQLGLP